jgi:PAS domain-containing protein
MPLLNALRAQMRALSADAPADLPFRWLFAAATEAVMIADEGSGKIIEANPSAAWLLRRRRADLIGSPWREVFRRADALIDPLRDLDGASESRACAVFTADGGAELVATLSRVRQPPDSYLLIRLEAVAGTAGRGAPSEVFDALEESPVSFVVADAGLRIQYANRAFISMVGLESAEDVRGRSIARWLELSEFDIGQLHEQMARNEGVTELATTLVVDHEPARDVDVTAVAVPDPAQPRWGFCIRKSDAPAGTGGASDA